MTYRYADIDEYNWLMMEILRHETPQAIALGQLLYEKLAPSTVIDIGCGPGIYLRYFDERGVAIYGIDGASRAGESIPPSRFEIVDLRNPWIWKGPRFDLALCIEVAEHLMPEHADTLLDTICNSADACYFSAAREGQGGEGHYNEQNKPYWQAKFIARGWETHPLDPELHGIVEGDPVYEHCHWLRWNGMLMRRVPPC